MRSKDPRDRTTINLAVAPSQVATVSDHGASDAQADSERGPFELEGYTVGELLGRGGMGEVLLARDNVIGREVAIKRMRHAAPSSEAELRFLHEAKIQARLEHPAIVPVHQLGYDADGRPYFTMKRLAGVTLHEMLGEPLQRLLRAFAEVCLAIEFAHEHGVIHRDVKPTNIMLGDFGEVYVLDWGVAHLIDDESANPSFGDIAVDGETAVGSVLGTPGYMAPEQALGYAMSPAIDVYALGCVLFEILTCEPLHPRGQSGAASAIARPTEAPSSRRPDLAIPPELDAACVAALSEEPAMRPSARALAQRIQDYLDGDRDLERRRALSAVQLGRAREALSSGDPGRRADAVHLAGHALALDPESAETADLLTSLIVEPPQVLPPALVDSLRGAEAVASRVRARMQIGAFAVAMLLVAVVPFVEVKSWPLLLGFFGAMLGMAGVSWFTYRRGAPFLPLSLASAFVTTLIVSRLAGPFVLTPVVICGIVLGLTAIPPLLERPWIVVGWMVASTVAPVVFEAVGWFQPTWWLDGQAVGFRSLVLHPHSPAIGVVALIATHVAFLTMVVLYARGTNRDRRAAELRLHIQAWHLQQLLPRRSTAPAA